MPTAALKILVLLDIASPLQAAVTAAARLAREKPATVELYDCGPAQYLAPGWADGSVATLQYRAMLRERRLQDLERLARPLRSSGIEVTTVSEECSPLGAAIAQHIEAAAPDVIVRDRRAERCDEASWQAETDGILKRHARCPILLVGANRADDNGAPGALRAPEERP